MRFMRFCDACADSVYQALLFPPPREARASSYAGKRRTGDEARSMATQNFIYSVDRLVPVPLFHVQDLGRSAPHGTFLRQKEEAS